MPTLFVMRSRFQPFVKQHYAALASLVREHRGKFEADEALLLLVVIRDYETLLRLHRPEIGLKVDDIDFRHLPLFNPLSIAEIIRDVREGIEESLQSEKEEDRRFLGSFLSKYLLISPIYLKFRDLAGILEHPDAVPEGLREIVGTVPMNGDQQHVLRVLNCTAHDTLDRNLGGREWNLVWLLPLVDIEDYRDWNARIALLTRHGDAVVPGLFEHDIPTLDVSSLGTGILGLYGIFACHELSLLRTVQNQPGLPEAKNIESIINSVVPTAIRDRFIARLSSRISEIARDLSDPRRRATERRFYSDPDIFARNCGGQMAALNHEQAQYVMDSCSKMSTPCLHIGQVVDLVQQAEQVVGALRKDMRAIYDGWTRMAPQEPYRSLLPLLKLVVQLLDLLPHVDLRSAQLQAADVATLKSLSIADTTAAFQGLGLDQAKLSRMIARFSSGKKRE